MAVELSPSVLATTPKQFRERLKLAHKLSKHIHIDIMDGVFVKTKSIGIGAMQKITVPKNSSIHAMVAHPENYLEVFTTYKPRRVFLQAELKTALPPVIQQLHKLRISVGIAISPKTRLSPVQKFLNLGDQVLILTVDPGHYHGRYHQQMIRRVQQLRKIMPKTPIVVDGHIDTDTLPAYAKAGANGAVVGSAVMLNDHPAQSWRELSNLAKRL